MMQCRGFSVFPTRLLVGESEMTIVVYAHSAPREADVALETQGGKVIFN